jgi:hypothetical protein
MEASMANFMIGGNAAASFREFCDQMPAAGISESTGKTGRDCSCLMDFVEAWLQDGPGIDICNGDYGTYMIALVGIIDEWVNWPNITDYAIVPEDLNEEDQMVERRVSKIFADESLQHRAFDRYCFERLAFARMYPRATGE